MELLNDSTKQDLKAHFDIKSLGLPCLLLGMQICVAPDTISLCQSHYVDSLLEKYGLADANPLTTLMDSNVKLDTYDKHKPEGEEDSKITHRYAQLIRSLMYLALGTHPDIAFVVNKLVQYTSNLKPLHWTAVKCIFQYLKYMKNFTLTYRGDDEDILNTELNIFCNTDWANNTSD